MDLKRCKVRRGYITTKKEEEYTSVDRKHQNHVAKKERVISGWVLELPIHILFDILSMLPMESVFSCKCVCKTFLNILTDRYFAELCLRKSPIVDYSLIVQNCISPSDFSMANSSDLEKPSAFPSWKYDYNYNSRPWRNLVVPRTVSESSTPFRANLFGSCNGLLCLSFSEQKDVTNFYVCNPILGEFMILPQNRSDVRAVAIGFCPDSKLYKVIRFLATTYCEIHTLGTNCWRRIENAPYPCQRDSISCLMKGSLHWITESFNISNLICSLNLESEQFHYLSPPSHFNRDTMKMKMSCMKVGTIGGRFCVFYLLERAQLEVYVMQEYGVESSWTKEFTVNLRFDFLKQPVLIVPRMLLDNGDLLVCYDIECLVYFSFQKQIFKELMVASVFDVVVHAPSFVSLKDIVGEKNVEIVQRNGLQLEMCPYETGQTVVRRDPSQGLVGGPMLWSNEEVRHLQQAVPRSRYNTKTSTRIAWRPVADEVGTRTSLQCKWKWQCMRKVGLVL